MALEAFERNRCSSAVLCAPRDPLIMVLPCVVSCIPRKPALSPPALRRARVRLLYATCALQS